MDLERNISYYGEMAGEYDEIVAAAGYTLGERIYALVAAGRDVAGSEVLDLGIGTGLISVPFELAGAKITGVDGSREMLAICRKRMSSAHLLLYNLGLGELPRLKCLYDIVISAGLVEFVADTGTFIENVYSVMKAGGVFVLAIRDKELNPDLSEMEVAGVNIDRLAFENHGLFVINHDWLSLERVILKVGFSIQHNISIFAYRSPTQGVDTANRLVVCHKILPSSG